MELNVGTITGLLPGADDTELTLDERDLWVTFRFARYVGVIDMTTLKLVNTIKVGKSRTEFTFLAVRRLAGNAKGGCDGDSHCGRSCALDGLHHAVADFLGTEPGLSVLRRD
jgi:hypothetical protein